MAALNFVNQLEDKVHPATSLAGQEQGFVNGGSLACFTSQLSSTGQMWTVLFWLSSLLANIMTEAKKQTNGTKSIYTFWEKLAG